MSIFNRSSDPTTPESAPETAAKAESTTKRRPGRPSRSDSAKLKAIHAAGDAGLASMTDEARAEAMDLLRRHASSGGPGDGESRRLLKNEAIYARQREEERRDPDKDPAVVAAKKRHRSRMLAVEIESQRNRYKKDAGPMAETERHFVSRLVDFVMSSETGAALITPISPQVMEGIPAATAFTPDIHRHNEAKAKQKIASGLEKSGTLVGLPAIRMTDEEWLVSVAPYGPKANNIDLFPGTRAEWQDARKAICHAIVGRKKSFILMNPPAKIVAWFESLEAAGIVRCGSAKVGKDTRFGIRPGSIRP